MTSLASSAGLLKFGTILFLILLVGAVYAGFQILPAWLDYYNFKDAMTQRVVMDQVTSEVEIRRGLFYRAEELGLPVSDMEIHVQRTESEVTVSTEWVVKIALWGFYDWEMAFSPVVVRRL